MVDIIWHPQISPDTVQKKDELELGEPEFKFGRHNGSAIPEKTLLRPSPGERERERSSPTFLCGNTPATLG